MATFNFTSSTNNANGVLWSLCTKLETHTDRKSGTFARGALIRSVNNLGVGVSIGKPFTLLS